MNLMPFADVSCMVIGIDIFSKKGSFGVLGFCATMDTSFAKYGSFPKVINPGEDVFSKIQDSAEQALLQFKNENKVFPFIVVVFRDGVSDQKVVEKNGYDYFVMPAKANQGSMTPTHFHVVYDDSSRKCDDIQILSYRLCYAYYNWSGSIRVPAPCQYAHKLAYNYGERSDKNGPPQPHNHWNNSRALYFL